MSVLSSFSEQIVDRRHAIFESGLGQTVEFAGVDLQNPNSALLALFNVRELGETHVCSASRLKSQTVPPPHFKVEVWDFVVFQSPLLPIHDPVIRYALQFRKNPPRKETWDRGARSAIGRTDSALHAAACA